MFFYLLNDFYLYYYYYYIIIIENNPNRWRIKVIINELTKRNIEFDKRCDKKTLVKLLQTQLDIETQSKY